MSRQFNAAPAVGTTVESRTPLPGTLPCDGSFRTIADYPDLAAYIGTESAQYAPDKLEANAHSSVSSIFNFGSASTNSTGCLHADATTGVVYSGGRLLFHSVDGISWLPAAYVPSGLNTNTNGEFNKLKFTDGRWLAYACGYANTGYMTSTDGKTWETVRTSFSFTDMLFSAGTYIFITPGAVYYGTSAEAAILNPPATVTGLTSASFIERVGTTFVAWANSGATSSNVAYSNDFYTWNVTHTGHTIGSSYAVANNTLFIAKQSNNATSSSVFSASSDGVTWSLSGNSVASSYIDFPQNFVVWDGAKYNTSVRSSSSGTGSAVYTSTTLTGTGTGYFASSTSGIYDRSNDGLYQAYSSTVGYLCVNSHAASGMLKLTVGPTANWTVRSGASYYPFLPSAFRTCVIDHLPSETINKGVSCIFSAYNSGSSTVWRVSYFADSQHYLTPYKDNGSYFTSVGGSGSDTTLQSAVSQRFMLESQYIINTPYQTSYRVDHVNKNLVPVAQTSFGSVIWGLIPTSSGILQASSASLLLARMASSTSVSYSTVTIGDSTAFPRYVTLYTPTGELLVSAQAGAGPYYWLKSVDGGRTWVAAISTLESNSFYPMHKVNNRYVTHNGSTAYSSTSFTGTLTADSRFSFLVMSTGSNKVLRQTDTTFWQATRLVDIDGTATPLIGYGGSTSVSSSTPYSLPNMTLIHTQSGTNNGALLISLGDTPVTTHFRLPSMASASDIRNDVFIYA